MDVIEGMARSVPVVLSSVKRVSDAAATASLGTEEIIF